MATLFSYILIPIIALAINLVMQVLVFRFLKQVGMLKSVFLGFFCGFVILLILHAILIFVTKDTVGFLFISNILIYSSLGYCYFHFINLGETARRIRILNEIYHSQDGLTLEDILKRYNSGIIIDLRLNRLLANKQLSFFNNRYCIKNSLMLYISKVIVFLKLIIMRKESEFD